MGAKGGQKHHVLGLKDLIRYIGFNHADSSNATRVISQHMTGDCSGVHYLGGHTSMLYQALSDSSFEKRIIHVKLRNVKGTGGAWSLSQVWAALDHPSIRELRSSDQGRVPAPVDFSLSNNCQACAEAHTGLKDEHRIFEPGGLQQCLEWLSRY
jgi:hypothetical protein